MSTQDEDHLWDQIDQELVSLERQDRHIGYRPETVRFSDLTDILPKHVKAIRETVEQTYRVYCEVWQLQQKAASPEFLAVVYRKAIIPCLRLAPQAFERHFRHTPVLPFFSVCQDFVCWRFANLFAQRFSSLLREVEAEWNIKIRAEARRAMYQQLPKSANTGSGAHSKLDPKAAAIKSRDNAAVDRKPAGETSRPNPRPGARLMDPDGEEKIYIALARGREGKDYCEDLMRQGLETPEPWQEDGCPANYRSAYLKEPEGPGKRRWADRITDQKNKYQVRYNAMTPGQKSAYIEKARQFFQLSNSL